MPAKHRHNISVTPDQWDRITAAAAEAGAKRGFHMSVSEWLRTAAREKIDRHYRAELLAGEDHLEAPEEEKL